MDSVSFIVHTNIGNTLMHACIYIIESLEILYIQ